LIGKEPFRFPPAFDGVGISRTRFQRRAEGYLRQQATTVTRTGNAGLDALADATADRIVARLHQNEQPRLLTVDEPAAYLGRTSKAVRHMIANGNVPAVREGSRVHLDRADLDQWVELRKTQR
jgi:excisionase family DNA binding protein